MPKTSGDELFERYLREHGYEPGPHEPDLTPLGIGKRPDYLPRNGDLQIACEVEQFTPGASPLDRRIAFGQPFSASDAEVHGPIRKRVASAAKQLKPLRELELPLVVVLANPDGAFVNLSVEHVLASLYGNLTFTIPIDPTSGGAVSDGRFEFGRDGKLTNDHPYLSAVALLRRREHKVDRIAEISAEERERAPRDFDEAARAAYKLLQRLEKEDLPEGDYLYLDVIETASNTAVPLRDDWFCGPNDTRWRLNSEGYFERIHPPT